MTDELQKMEKENDILRRQLNIAVSALFVYAGKIGCDPLDLILTPFTHLGPRLANKALSEIQEVEK